MTTDKESLSWWHGHPPFETDLMKLFMAGMCQTVAELSSSNHDAENIRKRLMTHRDKDFTLLRETGKLHDRQTVNREHG
jgi:hypothetical protein